MSNMNLSPLDRRHIQSDIEICNMLIHIIDDLCMEIPKLRDSYILQDHKAELQYMVNQKSYNLTLDKKSSK